MRILGAVLLLLVASGGWAQTVWKLSDSLGDDLGLADIGSHLKGWRLKVELRTGGETRTLYHEGQEDSVRLVDLDAVGHTVRVRDIRGGDAVWETFFDAGSGLPTTETSFHDNEPVDVAHLEFVGRVLARRTVFDGQGKLLYTDKLFHWPDGTLRRVERDQSAGPMADAAWSYGPRGQLTGAWSVDPDEMSQGEHREWNYSSGKTQESLVSAKGPVSTRDTQTLATGESQETRFDLTSERTEKRVLDTQGRTTRDEVTEEGKVIQILGWSYDEKGRVVESSVDSGGSLEVWSYLYRDDGTTQGRLTKDGVLAREEVVRNGEKETVSLFDRGSLFLIETWSGGKKVKESYYRKGVMIRERTP